MNFRKSLLMLFLVLAFAVLAVGGSTTYLTYRTAIDEETSRLREIAQSQARLVEAIAEFDAVYSMDFPGGPEQATLSQIRQAHSNYRGFGETGEFTLAKRIGHQIVFLLSHRHSDLEEPRPVAFDSQIAEPMRQALKGLSGTMVGRDYRGKLVLAAYEPVAVLDLGIVAKIDMAEIRAPFLWTFGFTTLIGIVTITIGTAFVYAITNPWVEAIQSAETRYRGIFNQAAVGIARVAPDGSWLEVNRKLCDIVGYSEAELLELTFQDITHPDDLEKDLDRVWRMLDGEIQSYSMEKRYIQKTGATVWIDLNVSLVRNKDGTPHYFISVIEDITLRKQAQEEVFKLAQVVEQSPESIVITNLDAEIEYVNEAFVRKSGYSREEVIGRNPRLLKSGKTPSQTYVEMWNALVHGQPWKGEFHSKRKDGTEYIEFARVTPIHPPDGTTTHYVAVKEDITEKKRLAQELEDHRHHLEELVAERTVQLSEAVKRAETANQAKSAFLANMSHEIRTPMNAIIGLTHLIQRDQPKSSQLERLEKIDQAAGHLLTTIDDILDLSKIEAGALELERTDFRLDAVFDHVQSMLKEQARQKGLKIIADSDAVPEWLRGDPTRLRQALLNYASNAVKFTEQGTINLRAKIQEQHDDVILIRFEVQDTGIGIEPDKLSRLFEAFEQADVSTTRQYGGTGLGLAITHRLAQLMEGEAGAQSEPGRGSTFWFTARFGRGQRIQDAASTAEPSDPEAAVRNRYAGSRILLAEDNAINREVATDLLAGAALIVDTAENGLEAVEKVHADTYDLVLMDLQMPEIDGIEATRLIRARKSLVDLPILAMTANIFKDDRQACEDAGMNDFVAKPVNPEDLFKALIKWLPQPRITTEISPPESEPAANDDSTLRRQLEAVDGLDMEIGLRNMRGNMESYLRLLRQFDINHGGDAQTMNSLFLNGEFERVGQLTHTLKGAAGTLGLKHFQSAAAELETILKSGDGMEQGDEMQRLIDSLSAAQQGLSTALSHISVQVASSQEREMDLSRVKEVLGHLEALLAKDDTSASKLFFESEGLFTSIFGSQAELLRKQIEAFDYETALMTVKSMSIPGKVS